MAKVETIFTGNVDHVVDAYRKMAAEDAKAKQRATDASAATKRSKREFESYAKAVERGYQKTLSPADQLKHRMADIEKRFKAGKMSAETYGKAQKVAMHESGMATKSAGDKLRNAFGPSALGMVTKLAGAFGLGLGLAGAISKVKQWAGAAYEEIDKVTEKLKETQEGFKSLWQVTDSREAYNSIDAGSKLTMAREGLTREQSHDLAFNLKSMDRLDALQPIAKANRFMKGDVAGAYYTTLSADTNWGRGVGPAENVLSGLIAGARVSKFDTGGTAEWMQRSAPSVKTLGATPSEMLGVGGAASAAYYSPETLATGMQRFAQELEKWRAEATQPQKAKGKPGDADYQAGRPAMFDEANMPQGLLATWKSMRENDPEGYENLKINKVRFGKMAKALEGPGAEANARKYMAEVEAASQSSALFEDKARTPYQLTRMQRQKVASMQKEVALEPRAKQRMELATSIDRAKALAGVTGGNLGITAAMEEAAKTGATYGMTSDAQKSLTRMNAATIHKNYPDIYKKYIDPVFEKKITGGAGAMGYAGSSEILSVPDQLSPSQARGMDAAMAEIMERAIKTQEKAANKLDAVADKLGDTVSKQAENADRQAQQRNPAVNHGDHQ